MYRLIFAPVISLSFSDEMLPNADAISREVVQLKRLFFFRTLETVSPTLDVLRRPSWSRIVGSGTDTSPAVRSARGGGGCCSATGLADFLPGELGLVLGLLLGLELKEIEQVVLNAAAICDADLLPDLRPGGGRMRHEGWPDSRGADHVFSH